MKYCSNCGAELMPGSSVCPRCGQAAFPAFQEHWTIHEVKAAGHSAFKRNYWNSVLAGVIFSGSAAIASQLNPVRLHIVDKESVENLEVNIIVILLFALVVLVSTAVTVAVDAFGAEMLLL